MSCLIRLENIEKHFDNQQIIHPLTFEVFEGEFLTLLGPSGCGKTTLLRMIAGFEQPTTGDIFLNEQNITKLAPYERDMNMVFQQYALFPHMNVEKNILFGLKMKKIPADEQKSRLEEVLAQTQLTKLRDRFPNQLSGGQQQRVAIARAIINQPKVLLLDEPLGALDYQLRRDLQIELKTLQQRLGITFVYVTHDQEEAMTMSNRIVILDHGHIVQFGTPMDIYYTPVNKYVASFIGENNILVDGAGNFCIRPEKISVTQRQSTNIEKFGVVTNVIFSGNHSKVYIEMNDKQTILAYDFALHEQPWETGDEVEVSWRKRDEVGLN